MHTMNSKCQCFRDSKLFSEFQKLRRDKWKEKMLGWCQAIARNPHRLPNSTRTPEVSGDASHNSTLVSEKLHFVTVACSEFERCEIYF